MNKTYVYRAAANTEMLLDMEIGQTKFCDKEVFNHASLKATASRLKAEKRGRWSISTQGVRIVIIRLE